MTEVAAIKTPFQPADLIAALGTAYNEQLGHGPTHATLAVLCAQIALETANGTSAICNNVGNFKRGVSDDYCTFQTFEYIGGVKTPMSCQFSAWPTLAQGCGYYLSALYTHWPEAWEAAVQGDPQGFADGLKARGYYTAPLELYAAGVKRWTDYYLARLGGDEAVTEPAPILSGGDAAALALQGLDALADTEPPTG